MIFQALNARFRENIERYINTFFVFFSDFRWFVAWQINFLSSLGTMHRELHVCMRYVNPSSCNLITSSLCSIIPYLISSSTSSGFIISTELLLIKSNSYVRDCSEIWQSFPSKWIGERFPTLACYYSRANTASIFRNGLGGLFLR